MSTMAATPDSESSRQSSSSPMGSPSRPSTPSQSSASSDFLPSDAPPLTPWTPFDKHAAAILFDDEHHHQLLQQQHQRKPLTLDSFYSFGLSNSHHQHHQHHHHTVFQTSSGMLLEDLMQDDAYEPTQHSTFGLGGSALLVSDFEQTLPSALLRYPSPSSDAPSWHPAPPPTPGPVVAELSPPPQCAPPAASSSAAPPATMQSGPNGRVDASVLQRFLVTTPSAAVPATPVVSPPRDSISSLPLPILIHGVPRVGAKSRVETQVKMTLDLVAHPHANDPSPSTYERVGSWKYLRLPKGTSTRRRARKDPKIEPLLDETLTLTVSVTCASEPHMPVSACTNCLAREAKRIVRKKAARVRPHVRGDSSDSEEEGAVFFRAAAALLEANDRGAGGAGARASTDHQGTDEDETGIVVFNCPEVTEFTDGRAVLPVRVTCYCRHHREKVGFRVAFAMRDRYGRLVGQGVTPPIMITDDHKSIIKPPVVPVLSSTASRPNIHATAMVEGDIGVQQPSSVGPKRNKRRFASAKEEDDTNDRVEHPVPLRASKRRAKEVLPAPLRTSTQPRSTVPSRAGSVSAAPTPTLTSTTHLKDERVGGFPPSSPTQPCSQSHSTFTTAPSSPLMSASSPGGAVSSSSSAAMFLHYPLTTRSPSTPVPSASSLSTTAVDVEMSHAHIYMPSPAQHADLDSYLQPTEQIDALFGSPSDSELKPLHLQIPSSAAASPFVPADAASADAIFSALAYGGGSSNNAPSSTLPPQIHRLIPASGPMRGGIEVTVLGANFMPSHRVLFGDSVAASTQMWSENTLVCVLPPSATPGPVVVGFEGVPLGGPGRMGMGGSGADGRGLPLFNYLDDNDRALMELALQVLGLKMTGRLEEAKEVAMRIVGNTNNSSHEGHNAALMSSMNTLAGLEDQADIVHAALHGRASGTSTPVVPTSSSNRDFQSVIIDNLKLLDICVPGSDRVSTSAALSLASASGQQTLLHLSAILGFHRLLKYLVDRGVDLDVRDASGYTALHFAALCGRLACARILVEGGADVEIVDARGRLAREVAQWRDQVDVQLLLEERERWGCGVLGSDASVSVASGDEDADYSGNGGWSEDTATDDDSEEEEEEEEGEVAEAGAEEQQQQLGNSEECHAPSLTATTALPVYNAAADLFLPDPVAGAEFADIAPIRPLSAFGATDSLSEKHASPPSEKNPQSLFHRTLSQLPTPGLPNLPHLPNISAFMIPQWAAIPHQFQFPNIHIPDMPLVFPVQMPTPSWPTAFQWSGASTDDGKQQQQSAADSRSPYTMPPSGMVPSWLGLGFYPGWFAAPSADKEQDPPMYTPSPTKPPHSPLVAPSAQAISEPSSAPATLRSEPSSGMSTSRPCGSRTKSSRRATSETSLRDTRMVNKSQIDTKDRMLFFFWIPILLFVLAYSAYLSIPVVVLFLQDAVNNYVPPHRALWRP